MVFRAALVDYIKESEELSCIFSDRIFDRFYRFEDFINKKGNFKNFPAMTIERAAWENENNIDAHDNLINATLVIRVYGETNIQSFQARNGNVRNKAIEELRDNLDEPTKATIRFLNPLRGIRIGDYWLRSAHVVDVGDDIFQSDDNREIPVNEIAINVIYSNI